MKRHICKYCGNKIACGNRKNINILITQHEDKCRIYQNELKEQITFEHKGDKTKWYQ